MHSEGWTGLDRGKVPAPLHATILQICHNSKAAGDFGFVKILHLVKWQFWCPSLKKDTESYVASCPVCALAKTETHGITTTNGESPCTLEIIFYELYSRIIGEFREHVI